MKTQRMAPTGVAEAQFGPRGGGFGGHGPAIGGFGGFRGGIAPITGGIRPLGGFGWTGRPIGSYRPAGSNWGGGWGIYRPWGFRSVGWAWRRPWGYPAWGYRPDWGGPGLYSVGWGAWR